MKQTYMSEHVESLRFQRNMFVGLTVAMACTSLVTSCFLFMKNDRIILTPPVLDKSMWVESYAVSPSYLEQFGVFLGQLLLNKSSASSSSQREILLRHCSSEYTPFLKQKLLEEEDKLKKQNISYVFYPSQVTVNSETWEVTLSGDRSTFAGAKQVSFNKERYRLQFTYSGGRLLLKGVKEVKNV
jgi:conjugal transfer pilus assembly protein TraE